MLVPYEESLSANHQINDLVFGCIAVPGLDKSPRREFTRVVLLVRLNQPNTPATSRPTLPRLSRRSWYSSRGG